MAASVQARPLRLILIVDETFVRTVLGGRSPIGVTLRERRDDSTGQPGAWLEIVGVVKDATNFGLKGPEDAAIYRPVAPTDSMRLLVRTRAPASGVAQRLYAAALSVHPDLRLADLKTMAKVAEDNALPEQIFLRCFIVIGAIALLLKPSGGALLPFAALWLTRRWRIERAGPGGWLTSERFLLAGWVAGLLPAVLHGVLTVPDRYFGAVLFYRLEQDSIIGGALGHQLDYFLTN